ncbi:MAG: hypothetical protein ACOY94_27065 [Bacillota bacterium]
MGLFVWGAVILSAIYGVLRGLRLSAASGFSFYLLSEALLALPVGLVMLLDLLEPAPAPGRLARMLLLLLAGMFMAAMVALNGRWNAREQEPERWRRWETILRRISTRDILLGTIPSP